MSVKKFHELLMELRKARGVTLRRFCQFAAEDPANFSRIERGLRPAPSDEVISRYASVLELNGRELQDFMDLGALSRREIPKSISEEVLYQKLPAFLRTIDRKPSEEELEQAVMLTKENFQP